MKVSVGIKVNEISYRINLLLIDILSYDIYKKKFNELSKTEQKEVRKNINLLMKDKETNTHTIENEVIKFLVEKGIKIPKNKLKDF